MRNESCINVEGAIPASQSPVSHNVTSDWLAAEHGERHRLFQIIWYSTNLLLFASIFAAIYAVMWEYSTRKYLKGFSDAIIPASAPPEQKIQAILDWMANGPSRSEAGPPPTGPDRDPSDTLNYNSLLQVCGTATNAFINLADSSNLAARRLLLLDQNRSTKHVDAEVFVNGRWIVVDPMFRTILRANGRLLTRTDLQDSQTFLLAIQKIPRYAPDYSFERTSHVRLARLPIIGGPVRKVLNYLLPGWEDSTTVSLLLERESLAAMVSVIAILLVLMLLRVSLRWYGERRLGIRSVRIRRQLSRACHAFLDTAS